MWSRYKAVVFSELFYLAQASSIRIEIFQIAETDDDRTGLSPVDFSSHNYPYINLFKGSYAKIPRWRLYREMTKAVLLTKSDMTVLAGYDKLEYWLQLLILRMRGKRIAVFCDSTLYDNPQKLWKGLAKRLFFCFCDGAFCYGSRSQEYLMHYGMSKRRLTIRCQAAIAFKDCDKSSVIRRREATQSKKGAPRYLYVGRLSPEKRLETLLLAFKSVRAQLPQAELVIVGSGPQRSQLVALAAALRIDKCVLFVGSKFGAELADEYFDATCLVLPSRSEPWGLVVNEALSCGCPAIVSNRCGCVPELIVERQTGLTFECDDVVNLSDRLTQVTRFFADVASTAQACLDQIEPFTPLAAAENILAGCVRTLQQAPSDEQRVVCRTRR
jgi:glycosyltransferase involved in cell wall biosynthesis